jgi:hypothetical protein
MVLRLNTRHNYYVNATIHDGGAAAYSPGDRGPGFCLLDLGHDLPGLRLRDPGPEQAPVQVSMAP